MPRQKRETSKTKIYHIMMRGNEKKNILIDEEDKMKFIDIMIDKKKYEDYYLYAYCLMDNHVHLIIKDEKDKLSRIMKRINISYAHYFNSKYERVGHVFQDRYKSEVIESEAYLLAAIRYVHMNPVKANIVKEISHYKWSSYNLYIDQRNNYDNIIARKEILDIYSPKEKDAIKFFIEFTNKENKDIFIDMKPKDEKKLKEVKAKKFIINFLKSRNKNIQITEIKNDKGLRNELIKEMKEKTDLSIRQIANIL
ncbi:transposase, partial [Paramaledivibacter caminithermalis]